MTAEREAPAFDCLVYLPTIYRGGGPPYSCVSILEGFRDTGVRPILYLYMVKSPIPPSIVVVPTMHPVRRALNAVAERIPLLRRKIHFRPSDAASKAALDRAFAAEIARRDPKRTILYFWPTPPRDLLIAAKARGFTIVREMINSPCATAKIILDDVHARRGVANAYPITREVAEEEQRELKLYDGIFASNPEVEAALLSEGIAAASILPASFGYDPSGFTPLAGGRAPRSGLTASYVGSHSHRKGLPDLLDAWELAGVDGTLVIAGALEDSLADRVAAMAAKGLVRNLGYVSDVQAVYRNSDVFVLPTHEDGGPQVTYEAAATGIPVITTPMGAARLVDDDTGIVCPQVMSRGWRRRSAGLRTIRRCAKDKAKRRVSGHSISTING